MAMSKQDITDYKRKYNENTYARIGLYLFPKEKEQWEKEAGKRNVSVSTFIKQAVNEKIERDK